MQPRDGPLASLEQKSDAYCGSPCICSPRPQSAGEDGVRIEVRAGHGVPRAGHCTRGAAGRGNVPDWVWWSPSIVIGRRLNSVCVQVKPFFKNCPGSPSSRILQPACPGPAASIATRAGVVGGPTARPVERRGDMRRGEPVAHGVTGPGTRLPEPGPGPHAPAPAPALSASRTPRGLRPGTQATSQLERRALAALGST